MLGSTSVIDTFFFERVFIKVDLPELGKPKIEIIIIFSHILNNTILVVMVEKLIVINPRGFCAGVEMAIKALSWMIKVFPSPIYCYHEIVHNDWIVEVFKQNGIIFVDSPEEIPINSVTMLSAHGTSPVVKNLFSNKASIMIDAVCPLVTKVHHEAKIHSDKNTEIIYVGHKGHDEAIGAIGVAPESMTLIENPEDLDNFKPKNPDKVALLAQTTLAISEWNNILDKAQSNYPNLKIPKKNDLCYATTNRQEAVIKVASEVDTILVVGSATSSNTKALVSTIKNLGKNVHMLNNVDEINNIENIGNKIAITAGASAPDHIVQEIINTINPREIDLFTSIEEDEYFPLPVELRKIYNNTAKLLNHIFPQAQKSKTSKIFSNDKEWTATDALLAL